MHKLATSFRGIVDYCCWNFGSSQQRRGTHSTQYKLFSHKHSWTWSKTKIMYVGVSRRLCQIQRQLQLHTMSSHEGPSETLKRKIAELQKMRKSKKNLKIKKDQFIVEVPESKSYLDTASLPMILTVVGVGLFTKLLMMVLSLLFSSILPFFSFSTTPISHFPFFLSFFIKLIKDCFMLIFILILMMGIFVVLEKSNFLNVGPNFFCI